MKQNSSNTSISLLDNQQIMFNQNVFVDGQVTAYAKLETRLSQHGLNIQPWSEATRDSCRFDIWSDNNSKEFELSIFKASFSSNAKAGLAMYKPDNAGTLNCYVAGTGNSFFNANNGNVGIGSSAPAYKLDVVGSARFNGSIGFFNKTPIAQQTGGAKTASAMYTSNEQTMLQTVYNALRNYGLLS